MMIAMKPKRPVMQEVVLNILFWALADINPVAWSLAYPILNFQHSSWLVYDDKILRNEFPTTNTQIFPQFVAGICKPNI
jgi:hypothetical protein